MKILLLMIVTTWSFGIPYPGDYVTTISSPNAAAIEVHQRESIKQGQTEPDHHSYTLFEVDLEAKTVKEIPLPKIEFKEVKE